MKIETRNIPTEFLVFDNGSSIKVSDVISEIYDMKDADWTEFSKNKETDYALYCLIKEKMNNKIDDIIETDKKLQ